MADPRFFARQLSESAVRLSDREARHAAQARRLRAGDSVVLFDGQGREAAGVITTTGRSVVEVQIVRIAVHPRPRPALTLAVAVPKGPRQDALIEKCTELGVARLWPILTARSVCAASGHRLDKWLRTTIEAAKQSGQCWLPELSPPRRLNEVLAGAKTFDRALVATPGGRPILDCMGDLVDAECLLAMVGPEGGWAPEELNEILAAGASPVSLGPHILRIETAAITIAAIVHALIAAP